MVLKLHLQFCSGTETLPQREEAVLFQSFPNDANELRFGSIITDQVCHSFLYLYTPRGFWSRILQPVSKLDCLTSGLMEQKSENYMALG